MIKNNRYTTLSFVINLRKRFLNMSYRNTRMYQANQDPTFGQVPSTNPWMQHRAPARDSDSNLSYDGAQINNLHNMFGTRQQQQARSPVDSVNDGDGVNNEAHVDPAMTSLTEQMQALHLDLAANPLKPERLALLPQQQQQVKNLKDNYQTANVEFEARKLNINLFEAINAKLNLGLENVLQQTKKLHLQQARKLAEEKLRLERADILASKFKAALEMPDFIRPPDSYRREQNLMDKKNIVRMVQSYDDTDAKSTRTFKLVWSEILNFGRGEYLNEEEYKRILSVVLHGNIAEDFRNMDKENKSLKDIVDELCILYDTTQNLDDYQNEVDNFKRDKNENIKKTMARANKLIRRLEPLSDEAAWPETFNNMRKSILRQVVNAPTRAHIDLEESRLVKAGASLDVESLVQMAHEYERYNNAIPTKDVPTIYQVATLTPKKSAIEITKTEHQLNHLKAEFSQSQNWEQKLDEVIQLATNAAQYRDRGRSTERKPGYKKSGTSTYKYPKKENKPIPDGDEPMTDLIDMGQPKKENRADNKKWDNNKNNQSQQRDSQNRSSSNNSRYNSQNRDRSENRERSASNSRNRTPSYHKPDYKKGEQAPSNGKPEWYGPRMFVHGDKHYYACTPCATNHVSDIECEKFYKAKN